MEVWSDDDDMTTQELTPKETARELRRLSVAVDKISKYLFGNGESGQDELIRKLTDTVDKLEKRFDDYTKTQDQVKKDLEEEQKNLAKDREKRRIETRVWITRTLIVTAIPYVISFLIWLNYYVNQLQPILEALEKSQ